MTHFLALTPQAVLLIALIGWNLLSFAIFAFDKHAARQSLRRIPERRLILLTIFGGASGAYLAQRFLRHKTRKPPFGWLVPLMANVQLGLLVVTTVLLAA
ncbi:DUF1294 domain-containing protein [Rhizobium glycinendophyticum]|uniref:DUF1294 domain-containing protein n=1 Tax=Rhizobium glycinendophyticum TaxID=2589807 RepID=A0A504UC43_9HYPH|nr:DUF1294 domain-containing protein [Rhizobium glycinendophyticum]TPP10760.1 DUF1294 domain-containing protein [Rhizobium glycinendophyticum]